jgi:hypothetical protein
MSGTTREYDHLFFSLVDLLEAWGWSPVNENEQTLVALLKRDESKLKLLSAAAPHTILSELISERLERLMFSPRGRDLGSAPTRDAVEISIGDAIASTRDSSLIDPLVEVIGDSQKSSFIRSVAAIALGRIGDVSAVDPLLKTFDQLLSEIKENPAFHVIIHVADALGRIGDVRAIEPLLKAGEALDVGKSRSPDLFWGPLAELGAPALVPLITSKIARDRPSDWRNPDRVWQRFRIGEGERCVSYLKQVLCRSAVKLNARDLEQCAKISDITEADIEYQEDSPRLRGERTVDCSDVRELAQRELLRRADVGEK